MIMRLDRALSEYTALTRSEIRKKMAQGRARVDGVCVTRPETRVDTLNSLIEWDGAPVRCGPLYLMMNKPQGVICATRDARARTVLDLVPDELRRKDLFPAGRLDRDTEGFLVLTDDGDFAHRILSPKRHVAKEYIAGISGILCDDAQERFAQGVTLEDGSVCRPALLEACGEERVRVVLREGMYHQVKRMIASCGAQVTSLRRTRIGGLWLDGTLGPGECRLITEEERLLMERETDHEGKRAP